MASRCSSSSCAPTRSAPAPTPASRPSPTASRSCASPGSPTPSGRCSTWPVSLAFMASGIILGYLLTGSRPHPTKVMNAILAESVFGGWSIGGFALGQMSRRAHARRGRLDLSSSRRRPVSSTDPGSSPTWPSTRGCRAASPSSPTASSPTTASGSWASPRSPTLVYTRGSVSSLLVMYAINVFVTFSLTLHRHDPALVAGARARRRLEEGPAAPGLGPSSASSILIITIYEKAYEGGWMTIVVTTLLVVARVSDQAPLPPRPRAASPARRAAPRHPGPPAPAGGQARSLATSPWPSCSSTASRVSACTPCSRSRPSFPHQYKSYLFVSVGVIDSAIFKGQSEIEALEAAHDRGPREVRRLRPPARIQGRLPLRDRHRGRRDRRRALRGGPEGVPALDLLPRSARLRERQVLLPAAPQRDGLRDPAPTAVRGTPGGRAADPRAGVEEAPEEGLLRPGRYSGRSARVIRRSTASRAGTPS